MTAIDQTTAARPFAMPQAGVSAEVRLRRRVPHSYEGAQVPASDVR